MQGFDGILMIFLSFFFALQLLFFKKYDFCATPNMKSWIRHCVGCCNRRVNYHFPSKTHRFPSIPLIISDGFTEWDQKKSENRRKLTICDLFWHIEHTNWFQVYAKNCDAARYVILNVVFSQCRQFIIYLSIFSCIRSYTNSI